MQPERAADYARQLLFQYLQNGSISRTPLEIQVHLSYTIPEPLSGQSQNRTVNPELLFISDSINCEPINNEDPEFKKKWEA